MLLSTMDRPEAKEKAQQRANETGEAYIVTKKDFGGAVTPAFGYMPEDGHQRFWGNSPELSRVQRVEPDRES